MLRKYLIVVLTLLVINLAFGASVYAETRAEKEAKFAAKVKSEIVRLGIGKEAKIEVKLRDKTKVKGYVSQIGDDSFVVTDEKTGASTEVPYPNAKQVKGNNLSNNVLIAIGIGILVGLTIMVIFALRE